MEDRLTEILDPAGCPRCGSSTVKTIKYTWWGGLIGPKLLHHTKCESCKYLYNSKTRQSNTKGIVIYFVVVFVIFAVLFYVVNTS